MTVLIINLNSRKLSEPEFIDPIKRIVAESGSEAACLKPSETAEKAISSASKVILSGTPLMDNAFLSPDVMAKLAWLKTFKHPVLGICAGMELLAALFGGELEDSEEIGMKKVKTIKENRLFGGEFEAYCLHKKAVSREGLRKSSAFDVIAESESCLEAIKHREKETYGVMFHPEIRNADMIRRFLEIK